MHAKCCKLNISDESMSAKLAVACECLLTKTKHESMGVLATVRVFLALCQLFVLTCTLMQQTILRHRMRGRARW